ncbi:MAG: hypothetical protein K2G26_04895 [Clostridia bacterium]|nr:hypothetical protein [Clostridia bacterium]
MPKKILTEEELLTYLAEYLIWALDELTKCRTAEGFINGEITAYVDCLEILNFWEGFKRYGIADIEKKYQIE